MPSGEPRRRYPWRWSVRCRTKGDKQVFTAARPNLFQFWDASFPPDEVSLLMRSWADDASFIYRRYDAPSAERYIADALGSRAAAAFRACAVPAMQADFFRYCALWQEGGVWVDADVLNGGRLPSVLSPIARGVLMTRKERVANDFLFVQNSRDTLLSSVIEQAIHNIERRISNNIWPVTGPGIITNLFNDERKKHLFNDFLIYRARRFEGILKFKADLPYKSTESHWLRYNRPGAPSIFRGDAGVPPA